MRRVLVHGLGRKNVFLGYKNNKFKKSKNWHFSKGVNPWFLSKNGNFSIFLFLSNIGKENVFYDILARKNAFLGYKNKNFKKSKHWDFSEGVNPWLWSKNAHFSMFFPSFSHKNDGKMALFGPKPWVNPFGKISIFGLFELLVFIA